MGGILRIPKPLLSADKRKKPGITEWSCQCSVRWLYPGLRQLVQGRGEGWCFIIRIKEKLILCQSRVLCNVLINTFDFIGI